MTPKSQQNLLIKSVLLRQNLFSNEQLNAFEQVANTQKITLLDYLLYEVAENQLEVRQILGNLCANNRDFAELLDIDEIKDVKIPKVENLDPIENYNILSFISNPSAKLTEHGISETAAPFMLDYDKQILDPTSDLVTRRDFKNAIMARRKDALSQVACDHLANQSPAFSAKFGLSKQQSLILFGIALCSVLFLLVAPTHFYMFLSILLSFVFLTASFIKIYGLIENSDIVSKPIEHEIDYPIYSILVPLYKEAEMVKSICEHIQKLNYPKVKLDVKLIFERDDDETIQAAKALKLPEYFDFIYVEKSIPQTKPKALNYAIPFCKGEYICVFDAEDRPDVNQLQNAVSLFNQLDSKIACLQAKLEIDNQNYSWLSRHFHLEYKIHFQYTLKSLAKMQMPLPLGGTSNHIRANVLREIGGWDAYNVTEDADLGLRLHQNGYRVAPIASSTKEHVSNDFSLWFKQRVRWQKGWLQTYIVHSKHSGASDSLISNSLQSICLIAMFLSNLLHPFSFISIIWMLDHFVIHYQALTTSTFMISILALSAWALGYLASFVVALKAISKSKLKGLFWIYSSLPVYWTLISFAAWWSVIDYIRKPFSWSKTPHKPLKKMELSDKQANKFS